MIMKLHHTAYRCRDSEETRRFYEDFLGLPLAATLELGETKTGRRCAFLHTFFQMEDGSFVAFFEAPEMPFEFTPRHDFDLHLALEVDYASMEALFEKGKALGIECRGIADHGMMHSVYFRDPNGYVIELAAKLPNHPEATDPGRSRARELLDRWQATKESAT